MPPAKPNGWTTLRRTARSDRPLPRLSGIACRSPRICCISQQIREEIAAHATAPVLHAKILFGYSLVGLLFVALVVSSLINFRNIDIKIAEQQRVADFHDEIRYSRRMEKNYLLYRRNGDLAEAIERANNAVALISSCRRSSPTPRCRPTRRKCWNVIARC